MGAFDYEVTQNNDSLYIKSAERNYRFPLKRHFYVFNDRRFNTQDLLVKEINGQLYFEEATMLRIFQLNIANTEDKIKLTPITS